MISVIKKRYGREVPLDAEKIGGDVNKAESAAETGRYEDAYIFKTYGSEDEKCFHEMPELNPGYLKAHREGDIHIHGLDFLTRTIACCQNDIIKLFKGGFRAGHGYLREPDDICSYSALVCIAIQFSQNEQHGEQSIPNFDYGMAAGVAKTYVKLYRQNLSKALFLLSGLDNADALLRDTGMEIRKKTGFIPSIGRMENYLRMEKELLSRWIKDEAIIKKAQFFAEKKAEEETAANTYQAMEAMLHNLNAMHGSKAGQIPSSSLNYGTDISPEGRLVIKNLLLATESGLGNGETPIFPIHIFKVKEGVNYNPGDPNYDLFKLACRVSAKRLFPNFAFIDAPFNIKYYKKGKPETETAYMGCRTRVIGNVHDPSRETVHGRGNLSFTTVNLPRIALKSSRNIDIFFKELDNTIDIVIEQLLERFKIQAGKRVQNFPFLMGQGIWMDSEKLDWNDETEEILKHGTLAMGFAGLAECLKALTGRHHGESSEAQTIGLEIARRMRKRMDDASLHHKMNFALIAAPAEGCAGRFASLDRNIFGVIEGITDREYYTDSFHIPVYFRICAFDKISLEAPYHELTNAGHITYAELDGENISDFEKIIRKMKESGIGYGCVSHPADRDPICGYTGIIGGICPACGRKEGTIKFERIRKINGYPLKNAFSSEILCQTEQSCRTGCDKADDDACD